MKTLKATLLSVSILTAPTLFAQTKKETFAVAGECGMCKKKIESTATKAGAATADWNPGTKLLTVSYKPTVTSRAKIEKDLAAIGYDTPNEKTAGEAYDKLDDCCKYDRKAFDSASKTGVPVQKSSH